MTRQQRRVPRRRRRHPLHDHLPPVKDVAGVSTGPRGDVRVVAEGAEEAAKQLDGQRRGRSRLAEGGQLCLRQRNAATRGKRAVRSISLAWSVEHRNGGFEVVK